MELMELMESAFEMSHGLINETVGGRFVLNENASDPGVSFSVQ